MIYKLLLITRKAFTPLKNNKLKLSVIYGKNPKTRKCGKLTESFVKQRLPIANIRNCQTTAKKQPIWYVNAILASRTDETTFKLHC